MNNSTVNGNLIFDEVCREKHVNIAYNNYPWAFEIWRQEMIEYPVSPEFGYRSVAWEWEIQAKFFENNNIHPHWFNCHYDWGKLSYSGRWSGAVGMIQRDEADYAIRGFAGTYARSKVAAFTPGIEYQPLHYNTRYPNKLSPTWNLLRLFTKVNTAQVLVIQM